MLSNDTNVLEPYLCLKTFQIFFKTKKKRFETKNCSNIILFLNPSNVFKIKKKSEILQMFSK
jgi:hypothetical protein